MKYLEVFVLCVMCMCVWSGICLHLLLGVQGCVCYKFILIFKVVTAKIYFIPSRYLYTALNYVIDAWECGLLDSCHVTSCLCNNVDVDIDAYVINSI